MVEGANNNLKLMLSMTDFSFCLILLEAVTCHGNSRITISGLQRQTKISRKLQSTVKEEMDMCLVNKTKIQQIKATQYRKECHFEGIDISKSIV